MGIPVPLEKAAAASTLYDRMGNQHAVARALNMPYSTVRDIVGNYGRWATVATDASYNQLRLEQKRNLQACTARIMADAMVQIEKRLPDASAPQAAMVYGILFDKDRLMAGESTQNMAIRTNEVSNLDAIAEALRDTLLARKQKA